MENFWVYVPDVKRHLFSVQQATKKWSEVKMTKRYADFFRNEELVAVGSWRDGTYIMSMRVVIPASPAEISIATETEILQLWHERPCGATILFALKMTIANIVENLLLTRKCTHTTPEQNGAAERDKPNNVELARSMLAASALPRSLWANACDTAVYLLNHTGLSPDESKSPHELGLVSQKTKLDHLKVFGPNAMHIYQRSSEVSLKTKVFMVILWGM
ncbi:Retrovirus-related Pol polyprotein like [Argiope bruennichi]|uniref:Retrovirus-related Pol polyprotein like n=1 Tax=Argiope bruennichi TaxID=94029 RepID=A0A8T0F365_ARGBR|nr:Retrovirus-related Pol polyprotein like [Argiope bruennichi]